MKLKYLIAVAVGTSSVGASHLGRFHGLRSTESLAEQQQKKKNLTASLEKHQHRLLAVKSTRDIVVTEEPADGLSSSTSSTYEYVPLRQRVSSSKKKDCRDDNKAKNIFYDEEDVAKQRKKKDTKTSKPSRKSSDTETCSDKRIACGNKRLLVCRHEEDGVSRTVCMKEKRIEDHLGRYPDDYCGSCTDDDVETTTSTTTTTSSTTSSHQSSRSKSKKKDESKSSKSQDETTTTTSTSAQNLSCATANPCDEAIETCVDTATGVSCFSNEICNALGGKCTEPYDGFFDELANQGSLSAPSMDKDAVKAWIKSDVWDSLSMDSLLVTVPDKYLVVSIEGETSESEGQQRLNEFIRILLDSRMLDSYDFLAIQEEFGFEYTARNLVDSNKRRLAAPDDQQCLKTLSENIISTLVLCLEAIGISSSIGQIIVKPIVEANSDTLYPAFANQFVQHNGLTEGFLASVFILFLTTLSWWEMEQTLTQHYAGVSLTEAFMSIIFPLMELFITRGWSAVANIDMAFSSIFSLFEDDLEYLNDCFGDTKAEDCEDFIQSGGFGLTSSIIDMHQREGEVELTYEMYNIPDEIEVFYEGKSVYSSGGPVSGKHTVNIDFGPGESEVLLVVISADRSGTAWEFELKCPKTNGGGGDGGGSSREITYISVKDVMTQKGYPFYDNVYDLNLVGIRSPVRVSNAWDDMFLVLYKDEAGVEQMISFEHFTTDPGSHYLKQPELSTGCAIVAPGHYRSLWGIGKHRNTYDALVQWKTGNLITVYRDNNKDNILDIPNNIYVGGSEIGINLHHGYGSKVVENNSAGCQVFRDNADLQTVLDLARKQINNGHGDVFSYTLLDSSDFTEVSTPPPTPPTPNADLQLKVGELTILGEGVISYVYWPDTAASGVTLGIGYDMGSRSKAGITSDLVSAGMSQEQADQISDAAGLTGESANTWVRENRDEVGEIDESIIRSLFAKQFPAYTAEAKDLATDTDPSPGTEALNARSREIMEGKPLYTYVMKEQQWNNLHPAMLEFLSDLKFHGGFYAYDRIARINEILIAYDGYHLEQFEQVATLFGSPPPPAGSLSYMDDYALKIGLTSGNTETFYGISSNDIRGATERRQRIRLSFLLKVIYALRAGLTVEMVQ